MELPDLKMTALAVLYQTKWNSQKANKPNSFIVKETLALLVSTLQDDDTGYFYDPKCPIDVCVNPGTLVGKIANSHLPYSFDFVAGVKNLIRILNSLEKEDYNRMGIIVTDCLIEKEAQILKSLIFESGLKIYVFGIGRCFQVDGVNYMKDSYDLADHFANFKF